MKISGHIVDLVDLLLEIDRKKHLWFVVHDNKGKYDEKGVVWFDLDSTNVCTTTNYGWKMHNHKSGLFYNKIGAKTPHLFQPYDLGSSFRRQWWHRRNWLLRRMIHLFELQDSGTAFCRSCCIRQVHPQGSKTKCNHGLYHHITAPQDQMLLWRVCPEIIYHCWNDWRKHEKVCWSVPNDELIICWFLTKIFCWRNHFWHQFLHACNKCWIMARKKILLDCLIGLILTSIILVSSKKEPRTMMIWSENSTNIYFTCVKLSFNSILM